MNKKLILIIFLSICCFIAGFFLYKTLKKYEHDENAALHQKTLPSFEFFTINNEPFNNKSLTPQLPTVVAYFNPGCDHCTEIAEKIISEKPDFSKVNFLMITSADRLDVSNFLTKYNALEKANVKILIDSKHNMNNSFGLTAVPSFLVYNANGSLLKKINGETSLNNILKIANERS
jgi:protein-disulfide isomerase